MDQHTLGTTYVFPDQMQPAIEMESVKPTPRGWGVGSKGHVRSASHGGVSLFNPAVQPHQHQPSAAIGFLEEATAGLGKTDRASENVVSSASPPLKTPAGKLGILFYENELPTWYVQAFFQFFLHIKLSNTRFIYESNHDTF